MAAKRVQIPPPDPQRLERATALADRAPLPARAGSVFFGTAGWTDRTLIESGAFYPRAKQDPEARLRFYAQHFPMVEVDATYYTLLPRETSERWVSWTPESFRFDVKAFPILTEHPIDVTRLPKELREACQSLGFERRVYPDKLPDELGRELRARFSDFLAPLVAAGRLGAVLLQFPPWFTSTQGNVRKIELLRAEFPDLPFAVEFRHASWFDEQRRGRVLDALRGLGMSYVCIDEPLIDSALLAVTNPALAVLRFHGRNTSGWKKRGASVHERFDYLYEPDELAAWVEPVRRLASESNTVHAVFNNCVRNYAVLNAKDLAALLEPAR